VNVGIFSLMQWPTDRTAERVYGDEIAQAVEAERLGFDRAWFAEHHFSRYGIAPAIHLTLANVAARTSRIRLGTAVTVLPFMHPVRAAEELASLDILSGGRIDWGVGRGYQRHEFDAFEVEISESRPRFEESLDIIFRCWEDGPFEHEGRFWKFGPVDVLPKPVQQPRIPTFVAAISPESVEWAAGRGLPLLVDQFSSYDRLAEAHKKYDEAWRQAGHGEPAEAVALRQVFVGRTREEARAAAAPGLLWYYRMLAKVGSPARHDEEMPSGYEAYRIFGMLSGMTEGDPDDFLDLLLDQVAVAGTAEEVTDRLTGLHEAGYPSVIAWMNFGGLPHEETVASMRRFIDQVAPNLPR
jgi:alkanesulfonate monooxygenase SsuD/methylene tetrahydromethanopterin reductase-like flavin-dependent oxidoreductase (luciferase family)